MWLHRPRWRKLVRDLWLNKARTLLVILAIAIGVFGVSSISTAYAVLMREMDRNYLDTNPAAAVLTTAPLPDRAVESIRRIAGVGSVEIRREAQARIQTPTGEWRTLLLFAFTDYKAMQIDTITSDSGAWPPAPGEILLERAAVRVAGQAAGDRARVRMPGGRELELPVTGIVHAPGLPPAWMEGMVYGFVTPGTLDALGGTGSFQLRLTVAENGGDREYIRTVAARVEDWLQSQGYGVTATQVPVPGKHPHGDQMQTLLFLFESFGILALILSGVLVANLIASLVSRQIRQIGLMKAIGATTWQVMQIYLGSVLVLALAALVIGIPAGMAAGRAYSVFAAHMLNFEVASFAVPAWVYGLQVMAGLLVPLAVAVWPVLRGSRVTVRQAMADYGVDPGRFARDSWLMRIRFLSRPLLLSLRNALRRPGRLALTLATLAAGGAAFMVALNVAAGWSGTVAAAFDSRRFDLELRLTQPGNAAAIEKVVRAVPGVAGAEAWGDTAAAFVDGPGGRVGNRFSLYAPPVPTQLFAPEVLEGRWLAPGDTDAVVLNHGLAEREPGLKVGDRVNLRVGQRESTGVVVGIIREVGSEPSAYVPNQADLARNVRVAMGAGNPGAVEQALREAGYEVAAAQLLSERQKVMEDHLMPILSLLLAMSLLVVAVGGLALATTMSISTLERTREIGVMMSLGATDRTLVRLIVAEGVIIGLLSWLGAVMLSFPLTVVVGSVAGSIFIKTPIQAVFAWTGMGLWLVLAGAIAALASRAPARAAARLTVRETLSYE